MADAFMSIIRYAITLRVKRERRKEFDEALDKLIDHERKTFGERGGLIRDEGCINWGCFRCWRGDEIHGRKDEVILEWEWTTPGNYENQIKYWKADKTREEAMDRLRSECEPDIGTLWNRYKPAG